MNRLLIMLTSVIGLGAPALAQDGDAALSGQIDLGYRYYVDDGAYPGQTERGFYPFVGFQLNGTLSAGSGQFVLQLAGVNDDRNDRSLLNIQKAYFTNSFDSWDLVLGYNVEDWGVSNGRTIVNVLNAKNQTNQVDNSDLIGTPLANVNLFSDVGTFSFYLLGDNVEGSFGGPATRQRGPFYTNDELTRYEDDNSLDAAFRFSNSYAIGEASLDIGLSIYDGTNRESLRLPGCVQAERIVSAAACDAFNTDVLAGYENGATPTSAALDAGAGALTALGPYYQEMRQYGLTAVYARNNTQLRFEGFRREAAGENFVAAIVGGEQAFYNFLGGEGTLFTALEYHYDDRSDRQPITVYDDDLFLGLRYMQNDANDSRADFGMFYDLEENSQIFTLALSRRVGDRVRIGLNATHINADSAADPLSTVDGDSYIEFVLSTFF